MNIQSVDTRAVTLPKTVGALDEAPPQVSRDFVTLRTRTSDGIEGVGYAGFAAPLLTKALKETVDALAEQVIGDDPLMVEAINAKLLDLGGHGSPSGLVMRAIAGIDVPLCQHD